MILYTIYEPLKASPRTNKQIEPSCGIQNQHTKISCISIPNNKLFEREMKRKQTIPCTVVSKGIKYLETNLYEVSPPLNYSTPISPSASVAVCLITHCRSFIQQGNPLVTVLFGVPVFENDYLKLHPGMEAPWVTTVSFLSLRHAALTSLFNSDPVS